MHAGESQHARELALGADDDGIRSGIASVDPCHQLTQRPSDLANSEPLVRYGIRIILKMPIQGESFRWRSSIESMSPSFANSFASALGSQSSKSIMIRTRSKRISVIPQNVQSLGGAAE
jgi:hypothetical protein